MHQIEHEVRGFIHENFILEHDELASDASLTQNGVLDSMGVLELIMFLEQRFGLQIPDDHALPENLDSVERIVRYVSTRLTSSGPEAPQEAREARVG